MKSKPAQKPTPPPFQFSPQALYPEMNHAERELNTHLSPAGGVRTGGLEGGSFSRDYERWRMTQGMERLSLWNLERGVPLLGTLKDM